MTKIFAFPKDFLWGVSTSAYQIEGGIVNDWSVWEKSPKRLQQLKKMGKNPTDFICGKACDSYHLWQEDIRLIKELNCQAYRFGIEWARIEPQRNDLKQQEIEHYRKVLKELKKNNLKVVLTLWHWTMPVWVAKQGGWENKQTIKDFTCYVKLVVRELGKYVDYWVTLNEPLIHILNGYLTAKFPPQNKSLKGAIKTFNNLVKAHNAAYNIIHESRPNAQVSITQIVNYFEPAHHHCFLEKTLAKTAHYLWNDLFLQKIKNKLDYIGLDYYFHDRIVWYPPFKKNLNKRVSDLGWEIYPEGIYHVLKYLSNFKKPILILENGLADATDKNRPDFIRDHLYYVWQAIEEGIDVKGYFHWSLLDNFEWAHGFIPRFGLYEVDYKTMKRRPRPSAHIYAKICQENRIVK